MQVMDDLKMGFVNIAHRQLVWALYFGKRHYETRILTGTLRVLLEASNELHGAESILRSFFI